MLPEISEFSYGFALTNEFVGWFELAAAPVFPSLIEEGKGGAVTRVWRSGAGRQSKRLRCASLAKGPIDLPRDGYMARAVPRAEDLQRLEAPEPVPPATQAPKSLEPERQAIREASDVAVSAFDAQLIIVQRAD